MDVLDHAQKIAHTCCRQRALGDEFRRFDRSKGHGARPGTPFEPEALTLARTLAPRRASSFSGLPPAGLDEGPDMLKPWKICAETGI
jgi:hypothetical protein